MIKIISNNDKKNTIEGMGFMLVVPQRQKKKMKETTDIVVPKLLDYKNIILQWKLFGNHLTVLTAKLFFTSVSTKWL